MVALQHFVHRPFWRLHTVPEMLRLCPIEIRFIFQRNGAAVDFGHPNDLHCPESFFRQYSPIFAKKISRAQVNFSSVELIIPITDYGISLHRERN